MHVRVRFANAARDTRLVPNRLSCISARRPNPHSLFAAPLHCDTAGALPPDAIPPEYVLNSP